MAKTTTPPDRRPRRDLNACAARLTVHTEHGSALILDQVGWLGGSGAMYELGETPSKYEGGSWGPMYAVGDSEPVAGRPLWNRLLLHEASAHVEALNETRGVRELTPDEEALLVCLNSVVSILEGGLEVRWP